MKKPVSTPNGHKATYANLMCCIANGMPMIVMKHQNAMMRWMKAISMPRIRSHKMLQKRYGHSS